MTVGDSILLLGPPASGKGTQAALLARKYALPHVSLGEILRSHVERSGEFAEQARPFLAAGVPVPVQLMSRVMRSRLCAEDVCLGFIGDGLVRTVAQAYELDAILAELHMRLLFVFHIRVPRDEILLRTRHRVWCPHCGASYKRESLVTGKLGFCLADRVPLVHRNDDSEPIVNHRIRAHDESLPEIMAHYQKRAIFYEIDGSQAVAAVQAAIAIVCEHQPSVHG